MGWFFLVSEVGVGLGRSFFWDGIDDREEERACPWAVRGVVLVLVGVLTGLGAVVVTTVVVAEP